MRLLPLALGTVVEETAEVRRFQGVKTAPSTLSVRIRPRPGDQLRGQDLFASYPLSKLL